MKGKILIIEDEEFWQLKLKKYLELDGFYTKVVSNLETAIEAVKHEMFHFITLDMQLNKETMKASKFEGWDILAIVKELRIQIITPVMVITGFPRDYETLIKEKNTESIFLMGKDGFDRQDFLETINRVVSKIDLRFKNDYRGN